MEMDRTVLYALVAYWEKSEHRIIAEYPTEKALVYHDLTISVLEAVKSSEEEKTTIDKGKYTVHLLIGELRYACLTSSAESPPTASHLVTCSQMLLERLRSVYRELPILADLSMDLNNLSSIDMTPPLKAILIEHNRNDSNVLPRLEGELGDIRRALMDAVQKLLDRGQRLDELVRKTQSLQIMAHKDFRRPSRTIRKRKNVLVATSAAALMVLSTSAVIVLAYVGIL